MNKIMSLIIGLLILILAVSINYNFSLSNIRNRIYLPPASVVQSPLDTNRVTASGAWIVQEYSSYNFFSPKDIVTTNVSCEKTNMMCTETRTMLAKINTPSVFTAHKDYDLFTYTFDYKIKDWSDDYLKANLDGGGRVFDLTINFRNKSATIVVSDSQSNPTASSGTQTAILGR